jgi:hypothetical protein
VRQLAIRNEQLAISVFPNPAKEQITIECKGAKELMVIDYLGRTIKQYNNPTEHQTLNTKQLIKGIYIVRAIMVNGDIKTEKLVIE